MTEYLKAILTLGFLGGLLLTIIVSFVLYMIECVKDFIKR